ncbi:hypothetical protein BOTBODRAFT_39455 [Botryobasidium botryosum FD-172 SS1]|uniref:F-box domain-containing protein n=1 Tax=Botryobasidium botryosum (strain FD-172 SS1) TaxID=930990 RepID=A0A067LWH4_BOTB1|nr:hypothetical protein BOTBODRAFT_39455 [Botryobasidium botryosum FD-172 SS1]
MDDLSEEIEATPLTYRVPLEIIFRVLHYFDRIEIEAHPSTYQRDGLVLTTFARLSLVCPTFHAWANPRLYRFVLLRTPAQITLFARSADFPNIYRSHYKYVQTLTIIGPEDMLGEVPAHHLCLVLDAVAPSLKRLFVSLPLQAMIARGRQPQGIGESHPTRIAFPAFCLTKLEELIYASDDASSWLDRGFSPCWASYVALRRLALFNHKFNTELLQNLAKLPQLHTLVLANSELDNSTTISGPLPRALRNVIFTFDNLHSRWIQRFRVLRDALHVLAAARDVPIDIVGLRPRASDRQGVPGEWAERKLLLGELWILGAPQSGEYMVAPR